MWSNRSKEDLPQDYEGQNVWIKDRFKEWQLQWHDSFDQDQALLEAGEFDRPVPLPSDIGCDFRLIFGLREATEETRLSCFSLFPNGEEMCRRFTQYLSKRSVQMTEDEARRRLKTVTAIIDRLGPNEKVDYLKVKVVDRDTEDGLSALYETDDITVLLERSLLKPRRSEELRPLAARLFLTEPLYASGGNFYHVRDWVTSAMSNRTIDDLYTELYELWAGGWQVLFDRDGIVLAWRKVGRD